MLTHWLLKEEWYLPLDTIYDNDSTTYMKPLIISFIGFHLFFGEDLNWEPTISLLFIHMPLRSFRSLSICQQQQLFMPCTIYCWQNLRMSLRTLKIGHGGIKGGFNALQCDYLRLHWSEYISSILIMFNNKSKPSVTKYKYNMY